MYKCPKAPVKAGGGLQDILALPQAKIYKLHTYNVVDNHHLHTHGRSEAALQRSLRFGDDC